MKNSLLNIDRTKFVYLVPIKNNDLLDLVKSRLIELGFEKNQIINEDARKLGQVGDYIAQVWLPNEPTHLKVDIITKVATLSPQKEGDGELKYVSSHGLVEIELFEK